MSYLKLLGARRKSGDLPTMKKVEFTELQKARAEKGLCIKCGRTAAAKGSYICDGCQSRDTIEEIRDEIAALRHKLLKGND